MARKFTAMHRPSADELAHKYGLDGTSLAMLCEYDGQAPNHNQVVEFFLTMRSTYEKKAALFLPARIEAETGRKIIFQGYEWQTFKLPGGRYTPDWSYLLDDNTWVHVELKASKLQPGYADARSKLRATASLNPWYKFYEFRAKTIKDGGGFELELIKPDPAWVLNLKTAFEKWGEQNALTETDL
jgi:hypothetical protein